MITGLADRFFPVLNRAGRTFRNTSHAVNAISVPLRRSARAIDVSGRAFPFTFAASDAVFRYGKFFIPDDKAIEKRIDRTAQDFGEQARLMLKSFSPRNPSRNRIDHRKRLLHNPAGLFLIRNGEHRKIVFRHHDLCTSHISKSLLITEPFGIYAGIADAVATGQHKIKGTAPRKIHLSDPVAHNVRKLPTISRRDDDKRTIRVKGSGLCADTAADTAARISTGTSTWISNIRSNAIKKIQRAVIQTFCDSFCDIRAISRPRKIKYHLLPLLILLSARPCVRHSHTVRFLTRSVLFYQITCLRQTQTSRACRRKVPLRFG